MNCYLANGLFSQADIMFNAHLADRLRSAMPHINIYLPQENGEINNKEAYASSTMIANGDDDQLISADFMIAVIDGATIDEGVACEIGKFVGYNMAIQEIGKSLSSTHTLPPVFALFTDSRQQGRDNEKKINALVEEAVESQFPYRNLYVIGTIKQSNGKILTDVDGLVDAIKDYYDIE